MTDTLIVYPNDGEEVSIPVANGFVANCVSAVAGENVQTARTLATILNGFFGRGGELKYQGGQMVPHFPDELAPAAPSDSQAIYVIWSNEHRMFWRPDSQGYTIDLSQAGRYYKEKALKICQRARDGWRPGEPPPEIPVLWEDAQFIAAGRGSK